MKKLITLLLTILSCSLFAEYKAPAAVALGKELYYKGFYDQSLNVFDAYYRACRDKEELGEKVDCLGALDAYFGRMACYGKMNKIKEYETCLGNVGSFLFAESIKEDGKIGMKESMEFGEMFNESLFIEIMKMAELLPADINTR